MTREELVPQLPKNRPYWFTAELAEIFGVTKRTIQRAAVKNKFGRKVRHGPKGTFIFQECDLDAVCFHIHGERGNPHTFAKNRSKKDG